jgi:hypothetical protein
MTLTRTVHPKPVTADTSDCAGLAATRSVRLPPISTSVGSSDTTLSSTTAPHAAAKQPWDLVDEWGLQSFPASDPPSNW